jgi:hypothetical protein
LRFLYPDSLVYSYQPKSVTARNKSRIDFFLVSGNLLEQQFDCKIADNLLSSMFDHKPVFLSLGDKRAGQPFKQSISSKILTDPDLELLINLSIKEVYLIYQNRPAPEKRRLLTMLGTLRLRLREAGPCSSHYNLGNINMARNNLILGIRESLGSDVLVSIPNLGLTIEDNLFFEMILNHVRNDILSYQSFIFRFCS